MGLGLEPGATGLLMSGLTCRLGGRSVLQGISLFAPAGHVTSVLGPAGAGKSVLLRAIAGYEAASGQLILDGQDMLSVAATRRGFGVVLPADALSPRLSLRRNLAQAIRARGVTRADRRRHEDNIFDQLQLGHVADRAPAQVTPAERGRALVARAALGAPPVLLLDDPFRDQDHAGRAILADSLPRIARLTGAAVLLATRDGADGLAVGDHIAILRAGVLHQDGTAEAVFDHPRDAAVAGMLGEVNLLPGHVEGLEDDATMVRLACGPLVEARPHPALRPGEACTLVLRPDRIALAGMPAAEMGEGALDATLIEARFLGGTYRLRLLIGSGASLVVIRPAAAGLRGLAVGRAAAIAWQPHHALAFPEDAGA